MLIEWEIIVTKLNYEILFYIFSGVQYFYIHQSFGLSLHEVSLLDCDVYRFQPVLLGEVLLPKNVDISENVDLSETVDVR